MIQNIKNIITPLSLFTLNFILKGVNLIKHPISGDEPFSIFHSQMEVGTIIQLLSQGNNPPFYEIFLHYWTFIFGISPLSVRFPSLIFSSLTVIYIYKLCSKHLSKSIGVFAGLFFIFSNYQIFLSHESRSYALLGLLTAISMYHFINFITSEFQNNKTVFLLIIINTIIIYTHYLGFFVLITQFLFILLKSELRLKYLRPLLISTIAIFILYLPNIRVLFYRFIDSSNNGTWIRKPEGIEDIYIMIWKFTNAPVVAIITIVILIFSLLINKQYKNELIHNFVLFWFVFPFTTMFCLSYKTPMFYDRYLMMVSIGFTILLSIASHIIISNKKYMMICPITLGLLFMYTTKSNSHLNKHEKVIVEKIKELNQENTIIYICPNYFNLGFLYYYDIDVFKTISKESELNNQKVNLFLKNNNIHVISSKDQIDLNKINNYAKTIYLDIDADFHYPNNNIKQLLEKNLCIENNILFDGFKIHEYSKSI